MTKEIFKLPGETALIDINAIAYKAGITAESARIAGKILFEKLSGDDIDLTKALVHASTNSGADPKQILDMVKILADEFEKPLSLTSAGLGEQIGNLGSAASDQVSQIAETVKSKFGDVDFENARDRLGDVKDRGIEMGQVVIDKASDAIKRAREKLQKN